MPDDGKKTQVDQRFGAESGQAMTEYVMMAAMLTGVALLLILLLDAFSDYGWRLLTLVGMDYP